MHLDIQSSNTTLKCTSICIIAKALINATELINAEHNMSKLGNCFLKFQQEASLRRTRLASLKKIQVFSVFFPLVHSTGESYFQNYPSRHNVSFQF